MTTKKEHSVLNLLSNQDFVQRDLLRSMVEVLYQGFMEEEATQHIGASRHERNGTRSGYRNGYKPRSLNTRVGKLNLSVPQVRDMAPYHPSFYGHWERTERAVLVACCEMYLAGVSTRKVSEVLETMGGYSLGASTVSRIAHELDEHLQGFRERRLDDRHWRYLLVDATYVHVRRNGKVRSTAVLVVVGIDASGQREVLGWRLGDTESESTWGDLFRDLKARGLQGVEVLVSDAHSGIRAALRRYLSGVVWQRCRVHFMRTALRLAGAKDKGSISRELSTLFRLEEEPVWRSASEEMAVRWEARLPRLSALLREGIEDCMAVQDLPSRLRRRLNSTNMLERVMREIKRRTDVIGIFTNEASCDRLAGAILVERHERWLCEGKRYIVPED